MFLCSAVFSADFGVSGDTLCNRLQESTRKQICHFVAMSAHDGRSTSPKEPGEGLLARALANWGAPGVLPRSDSNKLLLQLRFLLAFLARLPSAVVCESACTK
jgi:hypothetical protein